MKLQQLTVGSSRVVAFSAKLPYSSVNVIGIVPSSVRDGTGEPFLGNVPESRCGELLGGSVSAAINKYCSISELLLNANVPSVLKTIGRLRNFFPLNTAVTVN